ncbi:unnamed protein product [Closterium sp. NIES-54]
MAYLRQVTTRLGSSSLEEARHRGLDLFRETCRALPSIMFRYNLDEVITRQELRSRIANEFRRHKDVENPKVIDLMVVMGKEEVVKFLNCSKQECCQLSMRHLQLHPLNSPFIFPQVIDLMVVKGKEELVIDLMVVKGKEELVNFLNHSKQRHHVISQWVVGPQGQVPTIPGGPHHKPGIVPKGSESPFLRNFYESN